MKIHKLSYRLVRSFVLFVCVLGAITLFTNTSFTGGQTLASAAESVLIYDPGTKTLTVGPGDLPSNFKSKPNVSSAETIVFVSAGPSVDKVVAPQNSTSLFDNLISLKRFQGMQNLDTSNVTNMTKMFYNCNALTQLDISGFNTSKVTSMEYMFNFCRALTSVDVSGVDTSKVTTMYAMFSNCNSLTELDVSGFNTSKVTDMVFMFNNCNNLTQLDLSRFDTSRITYMSNMFLNATALWKLTLGTDFVFNGNNTGLPDPVVGTKFNQNLVVNSNKWLQTTTSEEYTASEIPTVHVKGQTDTYVWQGDLGKTTVEYVVEPTYIITIPATITIPSATEAGTGDVTLSAYPKVPYEERFIHISATSENANSWHLTTIGDTTGAEYDFSADDGVDLKAGAELVLEADGEALAKTKTVSASLTDDAQEFKYSGTYQDIVTFTIEPAASAS